MNRKGTLIFFCGKMGAGKSTYSKSLANELNAVFLSEDDWLSAIYPEEIMNFDDYIKYSSRLKPLLKEHIRKILYLGVSVVMDFPGNTKKQRTWFKEIFSEDDIPHKLIYLKADDQLCLNRLEKRRKSSPDRARFDTEEVFHQVTRYFQAPADASGQAAIADPQGIFDDIGKDLCKIGCDTAAAAATAACSSLSGGVAIAACIAAAAAREVCRDNC